MSSENTTSVNLDDLSLRELIMVSQGFGHDIERLRAQRAFLKIKIDERIARGETEHGDATAPGAVIDLAIG